MATGRARPGTPGRIGLALAGGGFMGAAYELGALCALAESIDGLDLTRLDTYVGVSAGAFIAAGLVNGISAHRMVRMFVEEDDVEADFDPALMLRPAYREWRRALRSAPSGLRASVGAGLSEALLGPQAVLWRAIERAMHLLPNGLVDGSPAERKLAHLLSQPGRTNDFRRTRVPLRIVATDIDTGEPVEFGSPGHDHVPISRAAIASGAVPGLFAPVRIGTRHYLDGALNKTVHASVALDYGVGLVLCVNPLVPYQAMQAKARRVSRSGISTVMAQTIRTAIRSRMTVGLAKYRVTHPGSDVMLFEPRRDDADTFFTNIFSLSSRRRLCEHAYLATRADLLDRHAALDPVLRRHGLSINLGVLRHPAPRLVRELRTDTRRPLTRAGAALDRLGHTLDDLDRALGIVAARTAGRNA
ncbi:MAG: patatin-like phospholipase family protein [Burkholderiaceae bacterium]|nr:patatin-like phospholipase family protein [Burkholderiaceae bacterium]